MTNAVSIAQLGSNNSTMRNRIINGDMRIDQRNAGASVSLSAGADQYTLDRFDVQNNTTSGAFTCQQVSTAPAGFVKSMKITVTATEASPTSTMKARIWQAIEGLNCTDLAWGTANAKTVTLSFWVQSSVIGTFGGALGNASDNRAYPFTYTISVANTWEYKTVTIAGDTSGTWATDNTTGILLNISLLAGTSRSGTAGAWNSNWNTSATGATNLLTTNGATFYITGVQLEAGSQATPFEYRQYGTELQLCQRYYTKMNLVNYTGFVGWCDSTNEFIAMVTFPVTFRTEPTFTSTGSGGVLIIRKGGAPATINTTQLYQTSAGTQVCRIYASVSSGLTTGAGGAIAVQDGQTGFMAWSAEL